MIHKLYRALESLVEMIEDIVQSPAFQKGKFKRAEEIKAFLESGELEKARKALDEMDDLEERMLGINPIQRLQFELMWKASFNNFEGDRVVDDLVRYQDLWEGVVMGRFHEHDVLIPLRDIGRENGYWNVDELMILSSGTDDDRLELLAKTWKPNEVSWLNEDELKRFRMKSSKILRVWWD